MAQTESVTSDERLTQINAELSKILEEKIEFLTRTLGETQRFTQKIANTELEIQRNTAQHSRLLEECTALQKELETLAGRVSAAAAERDGKQQSKYAQEKEIQRLEWEISDKRKANEESDTKTKALEAELDALEKDNKKHQNRITVQEEGVARMKKMREEYLAKIQGLDQEMKSLADLTE
jgi:chromosome segregation ATPase